MKLFNIILTLLALAVVSVTIQACSDSAQANNPPATASGPTQAEFDELAARVEALERATNTVVARAVSSGSQKTGTGALAQSVVGCTFSGRLAPNQWHADEIQCKSDNGVLYNIPSEGGPPSFIQHTYFETADCTGQPMVPEGFFSTSALTQGVVFSYADAIDSYVGHIDSPVTVARTAQSFSQSSDNTCHSGFSAANDYILIQPNDPAVTGVENSYPATLVQ